MCGYSLLPGESSFEEIMSSAVNLLANLSDGCQFFFFFFLFVPSCIEAVEDIKEAVVYVYQEIYQRF